MCGATVKMERFLGVYCGKGRNGGRLVDGLQEGREGSDVIEKENVDKGSSSELL